MMKTKYLSQMRPGKNASQLMGSFRKTLINQASSADKKKGDSFNRDMALRAISLAVPVTGKAMAVRDAAKTVVSMLQGSRQDATQAMRSAIKGSQGQKMGLLSIIQQAGINADSARKRRQQERNIL